MAFIPIRSYKITTSTTAANVAIDTTLLQRNPNCWQYEITTKTADAVVKFGAGAGTTADTTLTSGALAADNIYHVAGSVKVNTLPVITTYVSAQVFAGTGEVWITIGYGERI